MTAVERMKVETAIRVIGEAIKAEYPESPPAEPGPDDAFGVDPELAFHWGVGDGFALALRGLVDAALPDWRKP